ncbi:MAG: redox protein [Sphingobium sp.]|jgi:tRNA 2-thiouridine synthesizing protein A|uniref:sulfurtransferase TusA family protein n=1 Tax=Sphingobium sp. TaxID=1912891 RepID=UPI000DB55354|nr:sulfurtransferase TusA family protein [Sphingobium sp.]PZU11282.1 MAG: redox protein [Sphingobium sp.]
MATSDAAPVAIDARGMKCPWPALRAARAMREGAAAVLIDADDAIAPAELAALAQAHDWTFAKAGPDRFLLQKRG